jgi:hypothetical protein
MATRAVFYDPELLVSMGLALDEAWADVATITLIVPTADRTAIRNLMASRIMAGVEEGVRDRAELKLLALNAIDWWSLISSEEIPFSTKLRIGRERRY